MKRSFCLVDYDSEQNMSMILGVGPALGFFLVPVIGRASDRCRSRYGRRRPFILLLSILLVISLFVIPYAEAICSRLVGRANELTSTLSVSTMVVGAILLDFSCQTCLTPCEALLSDLRWLVNGVRVDLHWRELFAGTECSRFSPMPSHWWECGHSRQALARIIRVVRSVNEILHKYKANCRVNLLIYFISAAVA